MITYHYAWLRLGGPLFLLFFLAFNISGQSSKEQIKTLLAEQSTAWNKGDIEGFMSGYLETDELHFLGSGGLTAGWHQTLERYKERYPDQQAMGQLTFDLLEITKRTKDVHTVIGKYHLVRQELEDLEGYFLIVLQKIKGDWKIVADSSH